RGHLEYDLGEAELVTVLSIPLPAGESAFIKYGRRQAAAPSVVAVAARVVREADGMVGEARIALGAAGPHPLRARGAEATRAGRRASVGGFAAAAQRGGEGGDPGSAARASGWYRRKMVGVFVRRALERLGGVA